MNNSKFTVVIPNFKRVTELVRALESVLSQELSEELLDSIIIVDDYSDNIDEIIAAVEKLNSTKVMMINNSFKSNAAVTRNQGARLAKTKWVSFLDSDDIFMPGKLISLANAVSSESDVYYNKALVYFNNKLESIVPSRPIKDNEHISDYLFTSKELMQTSTLTVRRSFFDDNGFNEKYIRHQDYDLCLSFEFSGLKIEFVDTVGTAIFWNSKDRPNLKGESFDYSYNWLIENEDRMSPSAINEFYYNFVVLKAARNNNKKYSLKAAMKLKKEVVTVNKLLTYCTVLVIPYSLQNLFYINYKRLKCYVMEYREHKNNKRKSH